MKNKKQDNSSCRLGKVGGQAVLEGVMMKCGERTALAVRDESGEIRLDAEKYESLRNKHKLFRVPLIRGVVNFIESMLLSYKTLMKSADMLGLDEADEESKVEMWLREKMGEKFLTVLMSIASVLGVALAMVLFMFLPSLVTSWIDSLVGGLGWFRNLIEGLMKIGIFVAYICLCSLMKEMRRVFEYHGAEHKSIACYEAGLDLTPANAATCTRFHPRCGTSFIFVILILGILINSLLTWDNLAIRVGGKLLLLPLIVGIGFEFIMYAGKHTNPLTKLLSAPGLWMQRITTREPDESQLEVAIAALKFAMPDEFPAEEPREAAESDNASDEADAQ